MRSVCFLSPSHRLPSTLLTLLLLLSLVMSLLPQPLIAQPLAVAATPPPVAQASVATAAPDAVAATINCNDPPPGERARVLAEDEVFLSYRYKEDNESLRTRLVDNDGMNLVDKLYTSYSSNEALTRVRQIAVTAADLNGDDKYEMISAVRDKHDRIGVVSSASVSHEWYADGDHYKSEDIKWVDIAAGDLDRSGAGDEVVVAFADTYSDIRVVLLDGNSAGYIRHSANQNFGVWTDSSSSNGRGSVSYVAVAAGDLNGDGFDDEIAVAFRDGNRDLQLLILRRNADGTVTLLWSRAWTNHDRGEVAKSDEGWENWRPIDVTTGDVNGDLRDEVVLAFRSGTPSKGVAQMLVVELEGESKGATPGQDRFTMRDGVYAKHPLDVGDFHAAMAVSVAAADLDGAGQDEIALAYTTLDSNVAANGTHWQQHLVTYAYVPKESPAWQVCQDDQGHAVACLQPRPGEWNGSHTKVPAFVHRENVEAAVSVATGDLDLDGMLEIAVARQDHDSGDVKISAFDADGMLTERNMLKIPSPDNRIEGFWLTMGDNDGDSYYATYTGRCERTTEAQVTAVIHSPPYWPEVNDRLTEAAFGQHVGVGAGTGQTAETMIGGSVKVGFELEAHEKELGGPSFTHEWEKSSAVEKTSTTTTMDGSGFGTFPPYKTEAGHEEEAYFDALGYVETIYWCYDYTEPTLGAMRVCLPRPESALKEYNASLAWWYTEGREKYPGSWVPVGMNLAQGRPATQSSTNSGKAAELAVDGNTDGNFYNNSVSHTNSEVNPWWQVDLGGVQAIDAVQVWNRTDCCGDRLNNFYIFVSETPFATNDLATLLADPAIWHHQTPGPLETVTTVPVLEPGRYVRIQSPATTFLHLAEVQVYGTPGAVDEWPRSQPVTDTQDTQDAFHIVWPGDVAQKVPGRLLYARQGKWLALSPGTGGGEFDLGFGGENEFVEEGSSTDVNKLGMEIKLAGFYAEGEVSWGDTNKTAHIVSWEKEMEFSGVAGDLPHSAPHTLSYSFKPYTWLQYSTSISGTAQAFLVLDYWVLYDEAQSAATLPAPPRTILAIAPQVPEIASATHPDPATWMTTDTATFTWNQPAGDPAVVDGYRWHLDQSADTIPGGVNLGLTTTATYAGLADGLWYLHVRARGDGGDWSATAHRGIRVDANPPQVQIALDPPLPTGNNGWYVTPVAATVTADDGAGAGVAGVEVSLDGATWQPYIAGLIFDADTPGATLYARAHDAAGNVSTPISTTFQLDRTAPDSHVVGGLGPGVWQAGIVTDAQGNEELVLAGTVADALAGHAGMSIEYDDLDWTTATWVEEQANTTGAQAIAANWRFTATHEFGAGNHIFYGRGEDEAGNHEAAYEIARVVWPPTAAPDLRGSTLTAAPARIRPGETVTLTLTARNAGFQEAHVAASVVLPAGLSLLTETLPADVTYDPVTGALAWPASLLWPGGALRHTFAAVAGAALPATTLDNRATFHAFWPNTDLLTPEQRQPFLDREQTVAVTTTVSVDPTLLAGADLTPPWVSLSLRSGQVVTQTAALLGMTAAADVQRMYLREWTLGADGAWNVAQGSGWIAYTESYTWPVSAGQGVKYIGVWVADTAGNISTLDEGSLIFVNRVGGAQLLADGARVQYRGDLEYGNWVVASLLTLMGDPDLYIWRPANGFLPNAWSNATVAPGEVENTGDLFVPSNGRYLLEVQAVGASEYALSLAGHAQTPVGAVQSANGKVRPPHPFVISDPLSAGQTDGPTDLLPFGLYLPTVSRGN
jgi:hypothetical protein